MVPCYSLTARRGHSLTSTSHHFDGELNRLAAESGYKGGKKGGNGLSLGQTVQARLPPIPRSTMLHDRSDHVTLTGPNVHLSHRCKWSSKRARR